MSRATDDRTLVLVRHAKTEQIPVGSQLSDHDRALTNRGRLDAQAVGRWLRDNGIVADLVICSTALRTRQTWDHAVRGGAQAEFVEYRSAVYQGGTPGVLETAREEGGEVRILVVVGHSPAVPDLAGGLSDGRGFRRGAGGDGERVPDGWACRAAVRRRVARAGDGDGEPRALPCLPRVTPDAWSAISGDLWRRGHRRPPSA